MSDNTTVKFISAMKHRQEEIAESAMLCPNDETYKTQAGIYQGLQYALDTLESIMRDTFEEEKSK